MRVHVSRPFQNAIFRQLYYVLYVQIITLSFSGFISFSHGCFWNSMNINPQLKIDASNSNINFLRLLGTNLSHSLYIFEITCSIQVCVKDSQRISSVRY